MNKLPKSYANEQLGIKQSFIKYHENFFIKIDYKVTKKVTRLWQEITRK